MAKESGFIKRELGQSYSLLFENPWPAWITGTFPAIGALIMFVWYKTWGIASGYAKWESWLYHLTPYVCEVSYRSHNLGGKELPGVGFKQFVTQARNAEMLDECDRYLVF